MWGDIPVTRLHIPPRPEAVVSCGRDEVSAIMLNLIRATHPLVILFVIFISLHAAPAFRAWGETKTGSSVHPPGKAADLVDIKEVNPRIMVDMKYATEDNFAKKRLYDSSTCFLRKSVAVKLDAVQEELEGMGGCAIPRRQALRGKSKGPRQLRRLCLREGQPT